MAEIILKVNNVDLTPYLISYKLTRADADGSNAGRTMDGMMHRDRVAIKYRIDAGLKPLTAAQAFLILPEIKNEYVTVTYKNAFEGGTKTTTMYSNNNVAYITKSYDGVDCWEVDALAFVEK